MRCSVLHLTAVGVVLFAVVRLPDAVMGYGDGAPRSSCDELRPVHRPHEPQLTPNPYRIQFLNDIVDYRCGEAVRGKYSAMHTVDTDPTQLSSCVATASAV